MSESTKNQKYIHQIDSLRAIAVLGVIIYHLQPGFLPGGYAGVDIFFVISGFLITNSLFRADKLTFKKNVLSFYKNRFFRIYPLYSIVVLFFVVVSCYIYLPVDLKKQVNQSISAILLMPNYYFMNNLDVSYFSTDAKSSLLLHLWSVGVEIQNYIIWGGLLFFISKATVKIKAITVTIIAIISFLYSQYLLDVNSLVSFYSPLSRMWEFAIGSFCYIISGSKIKSLTLYRVSNAIGFCLIAFSYFMLRDSTPYPGGWAIPGVLGAALLIQGVNAGPNYTNWILDSVILKRIGVLSYSIYLWHWPLIALYQYEYGDVTFLSSVIIFALTVIMSLISVKYIESPFREHNPLNLNNKKINTKTRLASILLITCLTITSNHIVISNDGYVNIDRGLMDKESKTIAEFTKPAYMYDFNCQSMNYFNSQIFNSERCIIGKKEPPQMLIAGDSNSAHFVGYLSQIASHENLAFRNATQSSCPPFSSDSVKAYTDINNLKACESYNNALRNNAKNYDVIFIGALWSKYYQNGNFKNDFEKMIEDFSIDDKQIIIALQIPIFNQYDKDCTLKKLKINSIDCNSRLSEPKVISEANEYIKSIVKKHRNIHLFDMSNLLCDSIMCHASVNNKPVYYDREHLSMNGSAYLGFLSIKENKVPYFLSDKYFNDKRYAPLPSHEPDTDELWNAFR